MTRAQKYFFFLLLLSPAACESAQVTGKYVDYDTGKPIAGARIEVTKRGWGFSNGQLVWDKAYSSTTHTHDDGSFSISRTGSLRAEAGGYQDLIEVPAEAGKPLVIQGKLRRDTAQPLPGGLLRIGETQDGQPFGWAFVENRITLEPDEADLFPVQIERTPAYRAVFRGAGSLFFFLPATAQNIAARSYGMLLRYADTPPDRPFVSQVELSEAGTLFVRTRDNRYAKVAFDPQGLSTGHGGPTQQGEQLGFHLILPFVYQPFPGSELYVDPADIGGGVNAELAGAAAQLPSGGEASLVARKYRIEIADKAGQVVERLDIQLQPGEPQNIAALGDQPLRYRLENVLLKYRPDGMAGVQMSIVGDSFVHHLSEILPNPRFAVSREFHDYSGGRAKPLVLRVRETF